MVWILNLLYGRGEQSIGWNVRNVSHYKLYFGPNLLVQVNAA